MCDGWAGVLNALRRDATALVDLVRNFLASRTVALLRRHAFLFHASRLDTSAVPGELLFLDFARIAFDVGVIGRALAATVRLAKTAVAVVLHVARILVCRTAIEHLGLGGTLCDEDGEFALVEHDDGFPVNQLLLDFLAPVRLWCRYRQTFVRLAARLRVFYHLALFAFSASLLAGSDGDAFGECAAAFVALLYNSSLLANVIAGNLGAFFRLAFSFGYLQFFLAAYELFAQSFGENRHCFLDLRD